MTLRLSGGESSFLVYIVQRPQDIELFRQKYRKEVFEFAEKIVTNHPDAKEWIDAVRSRKYK